MGTSISIEQLDEGYIIKDEAQKRYAIGSGEALIEKVRTIFGLKCQAGVEAPKPAKEHFLKNVVKEQPKEKPGFIFKEIEAFDWRSIPEKRFGLLKAHIAGESVRISRDGWGSVVWASLNDLKYLKQNPDELKTALVNLDSNKKSMVRMLLRSVFPAQLGKLEPEKKEEENDPDRIYKPMGLNRLTKTSGDGEKIEQEHIDELNDLEGAK